MDKFDLEKIDNLEEEDIDIDTLLEETRYLVEKAKAEENAKILSPNDNINFKGSHFKEDKKNEHSSKFNIKNIIKKNKKTFDEEDFDEELKIDEKTITETYSEYAPTKPENKIDIEEDEEEFNLYEGSGVPIDAVPSINEYGDIYTPPSKKDEVEYISYEDSIVKEKNDKLKDNKKPSIISGFKKIIGINDNDPIEKERPSLLAFLRTLKENDKDFNYENNEEFDVSFKENEMEDIFSTSERTVRLTNTNPLEIEDNSPTENNIIDLEPNDDGTKKYQKLTVKNLTKKQNNGDVDTAKTKVVNLSNDFDEDDELTLNILFGNNKELKAKSDKDIDKQAEEILRIQAEKIKNTSNDENLLERKTLTVNDILGDAEESTIPIVSESDNIKITDNNTTSKTTNDILKVVAVKKSIPVNNTKTRKVEVKVKASSDGNLDKNKDYTLIEPANKINNNNQNQDNVINDIKEQKVKAEKIIDTSLKLIKDNEKEIIGINGDYPILDNNENKVENIFVNDLTNNTKNLNDNKKDKSKLLDNKDNINQKIKSDNPIKMKQGGNMPKYTIPSEDDTIIVSAGSFTKTVTFEYNTYKKISSSKKDKNDISQNDNIISIDKATNIGNDKKNSKNNFIKKLKSNKKKIDTVVDNTDPVYKEFKEDIYLEVEDYYTTEDKDTIKKQLNFDKTSLRLRSFSITFITVASIIYMIINYCTGGNIFANAGIPYNEYIGISIDLVFIILAVIICRVTIINGFNGLFTIKGNADTAVSFAVIMVALQDIMVFLFPNGYKDGTITLYSVLALVALTINTYGKFMIAKRVNENFAFVSSEKPKYAAKIYDKQEFAGALVSGTAVHKPYIAYQRRTGFLKDFLKLSYKPDSLEELSSKFSNIGIIISLIVGLVYGLIYKDFIEAISTTTLCSCIVIPICNIFGFNVQLNKICLESLEDNAMLIGAEGVKQFCDSNAIMLDVKDLYTEKDIKFCGFHPVNNSKQDDCIKYAAALSLVIENPLCNMFMKIVKSRDIILPNVDKEHTKYESNQGIIGWVDNKRVFLGNKDLMMDYGINIPEFNYDDKYAKEGKNVVYIAVSSKLLGMFVVEYCPNDDMVCEMQRMENNGISFLIRTTDPNITAKKVSDDFNVYLRSVKILSVEFGNACKKVRDTKDEATRAYMVTRGKVSSFCRILSACVNLKSKMSIVKSLQVGSVILGTFLVILLSLISGISTLGVIKPLLYMIGWILIIWLVPKIHKL